MTKNSPWTQAAALVGLAFVVMLAVVGRDAIAPRSTSAARAPEPDAAPGWADPVEAGADHITAAELVDALLDDPARIALVDVRTPDEFAAFRLLGAVNLDLPRLLGPEGARFLEAAGARTVVLVSNGMTHPAQAWTELARREHTHVRVLEDGLDGLRARELAPPSLRGALDEHTARMQRYRWLAARRALLGEGAPLPAHGTYATDPAAIERPTVVSARWLAQRTDRVVVLDARSAAEAFARGHLPGALHVPIGVARAKLDGVADQMKSVADLARLWGGLGIAADTEVVVYAEDRLQDATHLVVALLSTGHERVAVLEGGLPAWVAAGRALSVENPAPAAASYAPRPAPPDLAVAIDEVARISAESTAPIVDVRPGKAFRGEESTEARAGHIPGSVNREYTADTVSVDGALRWRPRAELVAAYRGLGVEPETSPVVTCRTGHQASQTWFTLRFLLGVEGARWYDGSWTEWAARADLPAATGTAGT